MASISNELGYEDDRFANHVSQNFHCPICLNVLKDPVMCRRNQHHFCIGCITRHLENSKTCPTCMDELTVESLSQGLRIYTSCLSELRIRCDYFIRGCPDFVELGNLKTHVNNCGFSPVVCSNEGCNMEINKRDIIHHEARVCEVLRKVKFAHECVEMWKEIDDVNANQTKMNTSLTEIKANQMGINANVIEMKARQIEMKARQNEMKASQNEIQASQNEMKASQAEMKASLKEKMENVFDMRDQFGLQMRLAQDEILNKVEGMMTRIKPAVPDKSGIKKKKAVQQPSQNPITDKRRNIIVAGGEGLNGRALNSVEEFRWSRKAWVPLQPMATGRTRLSSFVYKNQIIVAGGNAPQDLTNTMEATNITQEPGRWLELPARLPTKLCGHKNVVRKDRLLIVGGYDGEYSNAIYEVRLVPPYPIKLLYRMPKPRAYHGVELHNDNIFIAGGKTTDLNQGSIASIAKYDIVKDEYREVAKLPFAVSRAATVIWRSYMLVLGGVNEKGEVVNTVVLYDIEKEECHTLPSMKHKRRGCIAVVSGDLIVVMGGCNNEEGYLKSVECFDFARYSWGELPAMLEAQLCATACCC